jgi:Ser/Thr protein kinase RdoA (MazF antagonist)
VSETPLDGGYTNAGLVVRVGDTVRRPRSSPATHALLRHLERVGFDGAPRLLGVDERDREILSFIPGRAAILPYEPWALTDDALVSVAELLRRYHDAVRSFDPAGLDWPVTLPAAHRGGLLCHNDPNLDNVVFRDGRAVALIDFDLACPGEAAWDVACASRLWAPLREPGDTPAPLRGRTLERLRLFLDAYGLPDGERARVVDAAAVAHAWCYRIVRDAGEHGHPTFRRMWTGGGSSVAERTAGFLAGHGAQLRAGVAATRAGS